MLVRNVVQRPFDAESGVADHHVQTAEALDRLANEALHVLFARHVRDHRQRLTAECLNLVDERAQPIAAAPRGDHLRPGTSEPRSAVARPIPADAPCNHDHSR